MLGQQALPLYQRWSERAGEVIDDYDRLATEIQETRAQVDQARAEVARALAAVYLPELSAGTLSAAERRTGFRGFRQRRPLVVMPREAARLAREVDRIESDPRWAEREALVGPQGSITRRLAEARDMLAPWEHECGTYEVHEGFLELVEIGYDTPSFAERWWQPAYWRHWAAGDRITAALGRADFGDEVLPAYLKAREERDRWRAEVARIERERDAVHALAHERDRTAWRRDHLPEIYLEECRTLLAEHLASADPALLATWAEGDRAVEVQLKRLSGLAAKADALDEMQREWLAPARARLAQARAKYVAKAVKLARPKKWNLEVPVPEDVDARLDAQVARLEKARNQVRRIRHFDAYDAWDLSQPPETWWLHWHDRRRPGATTPSLRAWYDRHPDVQVVADPGWQETRVDASSLPSGPDPGDLS